MAKLDIYHLGTSGVNLIKNPLHMGDTELRQSQNAELVFDTDEGGYAALSKRGGYPLLTETELGNSIVGMFEIRFIDEDEIGGGGGGVLGFESDPISTLIGLTDTGSMASSFYGEATLWEALSSQSVNPGSSGTNHFPGSPPAACEFTLEMSLPDDPGDDDHYQLEITYTMPTAVPGTDIELELMAGAVVVATRSITTTGAIHQEILPLTPSEIQDYRTNSGFSDTRMHVTFTSADVGDELIIIDLSFRRNSF